MPFWKQSEDPWDRKPNKRSAKPGEPRESFAESLKTWNEDRKAAAKEKEEAKRLPPEKCPWCGKDMEQGFLMGGRDGTRWCPGIYKFDPFRGLDGNTIDILTDGTGLVCYKVAWFCRGCGKMIFDISNPKDTEPSETEQEEEGMEGGPDTDRGTV